MRVPEQFLHLPDVHPAHQQMRGKAVPKRMHGDPFDNASLSGSLRHGPLNIRILNHPTIYRP